MHELAVVGVANGIALGGAGAPERVVAPAGVVDDGQHRAVFVRDQLRARRQVHVTLSPHRIDGGIALPRIVCVEEKGVDRFVAFRIDQAAALACFDAGHEGIAGADSFLTK